MSRLLDLRANGPHVPAHGGGRGYAQAFFGARRAGLLRPALIVPGAEPYQIPPVLHIFPTVAGGFHGLLFCAPRVHERRVIPAGAADRDRTGAPSLEGWCSTIELQRHVAGRVMHTRRHGIEKTEGCGSRGHCPHGAAGRTRTDDLLITNQPLYQLSYGSVLVAWQATFFGLS